MTDAERSFAKGAIRSLLTRVGKASSFNRPLSIWPSSQPVHDLRKVLESLEREGYEDEPNRA